MGVFFGEGAGLGMLSISSMVNTSEVNDKRTNTLLQILTDTLQAERVSPSTTKLPWSGVLPYLNGPTDAQSEQVPLMTGVMELELPVRDFVACKEPDAKSA